MHIRGLGIIGAIAVIAILSVGCAPPPPPPAPPGPPTTIVVSTTADVVSTTDGQTSLREAFIRASNDNADSTIVLASGAEYALTFCGGGQLVHGGPRALVVTTDGTSRATVRQTCRSRVMYLGGSSVRLERVSVRGGRVSSPNLCGQNTYGLPNCARGAGISSAAPLVLDDVEVTDNRSVGFSAVYGGGIAARAGLVVVDSAFSQNESNVEGGAVLVSGTVTISGSRFESNVGGVGGAVSARDGSVSITDSEFLSNSSGSGGAVLLNNATLSVADSVFRQNDARGGWGSAVFAQSGNLDVVSFERVSVVQNARGSGAIAAVAGVSDLRIIDSTIADNDSDYPGDGLFPNAVGGIWLLRSANLTIIGSTLAHNVGGSIWVEDGAGRTVTIESSIITDPLLRDRNCVAEGNVFVVTDSLVSDDTCGTAAAPAPAGLGPLVESAGDWFRVPDPAGPAVDQLAPPCATASDQRGVARPQGSACDLGAIEG